VARGQERQALEIINCLSVVAALEREECQLIERFYLSGIAFYSLHKLLAGLRCLALLEAQHPEPIARHGIFFNGQGPFVSRLGGSQLPLLLQKAPQKTVGIGPIRLGSYSPLQQALRLLQVSLSLGNVRQVYETAGVIGIRVEEAIILLLGSTVLVLIMIDHGEVETRPQMLGMAGEFFLIVLASRRQIALILQGDAKIVGGHRHTHTGLKP
jgi:hypothetical protein